MAYGLFIDRTMQGTQVIEVVFLQELRVFRRIGIVAVLFAVPPHAFLMPLLSSRIRPDDPWN